MMRACQAMKKDVVFVNPFSSIVEARRLMREFSIRHLPVVEAGRVVGVISIGDVVRSVIDDLRFTVRQLESYIKSGG